MAETEQAEAAAAEVQEESQSTEEQESSAETKNTEPAAGDEGKTTTIPFSRFHEVNEAKKAAELKAAELDAKLKKIEEERAKANETSEEFSEPPPGLSQRQRAEWYITDGVKRTIKKETGLELSELKAVLEASRNTSRDYAQRAWETLCTAEGVDHKSEDVQAMVSGLVQTKGLEVKDAVKRVATFLKDKAAPKGKSPASMETDGVTGQMTADSALFWDPKAAADAAAKGKRAPHLSVEEIFRRSSAERK